MLSTKQFSQIHKIMCITPLELMILLGPSPKVDTYGILFELMTCA